MPTSGTNIRIKNIDISMAGMVNTNFQLASHQMCMKHKITSSALVQETAIINIRLSAGEKFARHQLEYVKNDNVVSKHSAINT